jgi:hypothetical protein
MQASSKRTEEQVLLRAPVEIQLGGKEFKLPIKRLGSAQLWRAKVVEDVHEITKIMNMDAAGATDVIKGLGLLFVQFPEKLVNHVIGYAPEGMIDREWLMGDEGATDEELADAFTRIMVVAFPFTPQLTLMMQAMKVATTV